MADQRANIPPFGNWDVEDGAQDTEILAQAQKEGSNVTKVVNPDDPEGDTAERKVPEATTSTMIQEQRMSEDSLEFKRNFGSPAHDNTHSRQTKPSSGMDHSIEKSPMHKHAQMSGRGSSSPMLEGRATRDGTHSTPGRSRLASSSQRDDHDKGVTVPKFGEWDDSNPTSGEGYTQLFNAVREERQGIVRSGNDAHIDSSHSSATRRANTSKSKGSCSGCCPWLGI